MRIIAISAGLFSVGLPLGVLWLAMRRHGIPKGRLGLLLLFGAAGWMLAKIPKALIVLPTFILHGLPLRMSESQFEAALRDNPGVLAVAALSAGVFEELLKPSLLLLRPQWVDSRNASLVGWALGIGAGVLEAILILMRSLRAASFASVASAMEAPLERLFVVAFHGSLTACLVHSMLRRRRLIGLGVPIAAHAAVDFVFPFLVVHEILHPLAVQLGLYASLCGFAVLSLYLTRPQELA